MIPELAALVSGYPPHLNPRRGPASHPRGELGAVMQRGAGARARQLQHQMSPLIKLPLTRNRNMPFKFKQQITPPAFHLHNCQSGVSTNYNEEAFFLPEYNCG